MWNSTPYRVVDRVGGTNAYLVQRIYDPESGQKVVNRVDLLEFTCLDNVETSSSEESNEQSSTDGSDNEFTFQITRTEQRPEQPLPVPTVRRSARSTKGIHSNVHNLPKSVLR